MSVKGLSILINENEANLSFFRITLYIFHNAELIPREAELIPVPAELIPRPFNCNEIAELIPTMVELMAKSHSWRS